MSPHFFNVYMDGLSDILNGINVGCVINNVQVNHLMYADDTVLLAPSARALQILILLCEKYAKECDILFNVKKSVYMCMYPKGMKINTPKISLNGRNIDLVSDYKYLGVIICNSGKDDAAIAAQIRGLYTRGNILIKNFKSCSDEVKCQLFKTYCSSFYCCQLWSDFNMESSRRLRVAYNRIFRILMKLEKRISMSTTFIEHHVLHSDVIQRKAMFSCMDRISNSDNVILQAIVNSSHYFNSSIFKRWSRNLFL